MEESFLYLAPLLALAAACIGLLGPARREGVVGLHGLTPLGWAALLVAVISTVMAIAQIHSSIRERSKSIAGSSSELREVVGDLFRIVKYAEQIPEVSTLGSGPEYERHFSDVPPSPFALDEAMSFGDLTSPEVIERLRNIRLSSSLRTAGSFTEGAWFTPAADDPIIRRLALETKKSVTELHFILDSSLAVFLGPELVREGQDLLRSQYLEFLQGLEGAYHYRAEMEDTELPNILNLTLVDSGVGGGSEDDYRELAANLQNIYRLLELHSD